MNRASPAPERPEPDRVRPRPWIRRRHWIRGAVAVVALAAIAAALAASAGLVTASRPADGGLMPVVTFSPAGTPGASDGRLSTGGVRPDQRDMPGLSKLDPALLDAVRLADAAAARDGIEVRITSGWRSRKYQQDLLDRAIVTYGSRAEALRFVALPDRSRHVTGEAVDIGPTDAAYWFAQHGAEYGLCQTFANEIWHYELLVEPGGVCPEMSADGSS